MNLRKNTPKDRLNLLYEHLEKTKIDFALISDPRHVFYFTGLLVHKFRFTSMLFLNGRTGHSLLLVGRSEETRAKQAFNGDILAFDDYDLEKRMIAYPNFVSEVLEQNLELIFSDSFQDWPEKRIGIEYWHLPQQYLQSIQRRYGARISKFENISELILSFRKTKGPDEIRDHKASASRLDFAYGIAQQNARVGITEADLYREVNYEVIKRFGPFAFAEMHNILGDYVSGERTLEMGGPPTKRTFRAGDTIILDLQACVHGYWADDARTFIVRKKSNERQKKVFKTILRAKRKAEALLRPGTTCAEVYKVVSKEIMDSGYSSFLPHHAGHGLGLEDQEPPFFLPFSKDILEPGVVCALEPGIYDAESGGMRFEDDYVITEDGFDKISKYPITLP